MVGKGKCEIQLEGQEQQHLDEGDLVLLNAPPRWVLMDGLDAQLEDFEATYAGVDGNTAFIGKSASGPLTQLLGGQISFGPGNVELLRDALPAMLRIPSLSPSSGRLQKVLEWIGDEAVSERPGRSLILERLLEIMLVEAPCLNPLDSGITQGLLAAMADPQLAAALHVMHAKFQRNWTVTELASVSGMSRSVFAERFARVVGLAPIDYLLHLRMVIAKTYFSLQKSARPRSLSCAATSQLLRLARPFAGSLVRLLARTPSECRLILSSPRSSDT